MFQKPAFGSNTSGFGSFNAGTSAATPFGGFKTNTGTSAFGAPPAFGASTSAQPTTGGGLFGAAQPSTSLFGNTSASTSAPPFGASTSGFGFGGGASTSTGLFAQPNTSGGLFSNTQATPAFGTKPSGFGFGNTATSGTTTGGLFGSTQNTGTSLFGQQNTSLGGGLFSNTNNTFGQQAPTGTAHVKYNPAVGTDVVVKGGTSQNVIIKHHCITCMKEYENKSLEELRLEDYTAGRKGTQGAGVFGGFQATTENKPLFGGSTFGQPATTSAPSVFGGGGLNTSTGFGQTNTFSFGNNAQNTTNTTGGLFGAAKPAFGAPATSGTGLFGAASTQASTFGTNTSTFGFGANTQNQTTGLFGAKPATTGFGAPATSGFGGFGAASTAPSLFGAKPQQTTAPAFGTATPWLSVAELIRLELSAYMLEVRLLRRNMTEMHQISNGVTEIKDTLNRICTRMDAIEGHIASTGQVSDLEERAQNLTLNDRNRDEPTSNDQTTRQSAGAQNDARQSVDAESQTYGSQRTVATANDVKLATRELSELKQRVAQNLTINVRNRYDAGTSNDDHTINQPSVAERHDNDTRKSVDAESVDAETKDSPSDVGIAIKHKLDTSKISELEFKAQNLKLNDENEPGSSNVESINTPAMNERNGDDVRKLFDAKNNTDSPRPSDVEKVTGVKPATSHVSELEYKVAQNLTLNDQNHDDLGTSNAVSTDTMTDGESDGDDVIKSKDARSQKRDTPKAVVTADQRDETSKPTLETAAQGLDTPKQTNVVAFQRDDVLTKTEEATSQGVDTPKTTEHEILVKPEDRKYGSPIRTNGAKETLERPNTVKFEPARIDVPSRFFTKPWFLEEDNVTDNVGTQIEVTKSQVKDIKPLFGKHDEYKNDSLRRINNQGEDILEQPESSAQGLDIPRQTNIVASQRNDVLTHPEAASSVEEVNQLDKAEDHENDIPIRTNGPGEDTSVQPNTEPNIEVRKPFGFGWSLEKWEDL